MRSEEDYGIKCRRSNGFDFGNHRMWYCSDAVGAVASSFAVYHYYGKDDMMELSVKVSAGLLLALSAAMSASAQFVVWNDMTGDSLHDATDFYQEERIEVNPNLQEITFPQIAAENQRLALHEEYDALSWASAVDEQDGDISANISVYGYVNTAQKGTYDLRYVVRNSYGLKDSKQIRVIVD